MSNGSSESGQSQATFASSSVCDRIAFAWPSRRNRTAGVPSGEKARKACRQRRAGHSLWSGFKASFAKLRPFPAISRAIQADFSTLQTVWRREWDSRRPFVTVLARSIRCRKPLSLPLVRFYHIWNTSHTKNVDSLELRKSRYGRYGRDFLVTPPTLPLYRHARSAISQRPPKLATSSWVLMMTAAPGRNFVSNRYGRVGNKRWFGSTELMSPIF